jgi:quinol-cytochrome oxidoreductase complex cytochrome b subunit
MSDIIKVPNKRQVVKADGGKKDLAQQFYEGQIYTSIFRHDYKDNKRNRALQIVNNVFLHLHPTRVSRHAIDVGYTWGMGGITLLLFIVTAVTGILLMFYYRPTSEYAYNDMKQLMHDVPFGAFIRNMHRWAAHAMVICVMLHMYRVFLTGSYKPPREFNWVIGVNLLVLTLALSFTGYLLPWDQLAIWAITVGSNMARAVPFLGHAGPFAPEFHQLVGFGGAPDADVRFILLGGTEVGAPTLLRFYVLHTVFLPIVTAVLLAVHFWRIRKDGGISGPPMIEFHKAVTDASKLKVSVVDHLPKYEYVEGFKQAEGEQNFKEVVKKDLDTLKQKTSTKLSNLINAIDQAAEQNIKGGDDSHSHDDHHDNSNDHDKNHNNNNDHH